MKSKRCLLFTGPDGSQWAVAAEVVAHDRAKYYSEDDPNRTYEAEFEYTMKDRYELEDWYGNNMNPEDVAPYAVRVKRAVPMGFLDVAKSESTERGPVIPLDAWRLPLPPGHAE